MKKKILVIIAVAIIAVMAFLIVSALKSYSDNREIPEGLSNLIPMYGNTGSVDRRTDRLKEADEKFIQNATNGGQISKVDASMYLAIVGGWDYYFQKDYETSMKRFNEAWLLNADNYQAFWGFGLLLMEQQKFDESITMLEKALELYAKNNQLEILNPWYEKKVDETKLTQQQIDFKKWINAMYESSNSLILCDLGNAYYKKARDLQSNLEKQQYISKAQELINDATNNKTITKNLDNCYKILAETQDMQ